MIGERSKIDLQRIFNYALCPPASDPQTAADFSLFYPCLLFGIFTPRILSEFKEFSSRIPAEVQKVIPEELRTLPLDDSLAPSVYQFHLNRAVSVLTGYSNCSVPLTSDTRVRTRSRNLLSDQGQNLLKRLSHRLKTQDDSRNGSLLEVLKAGHPLFLDTDLFEEPYFSPLLKFDRPTLLSLSSGCYNHCAHCGYGPAQPVAHTPYPILLKAAEFLHAEGALMPYFHTNSDPISYHDPIIGADAGDVFFSLKELGTPSPAFVTKGVLQPYTKTALLKLAFSHLSHVTFSLVNLPGENYEKNTQRISETTRLARSAGLPYNIQYYHEHQARAHEASVKRQFDVPSHSTVLGITPVPLGNWYLNNPHLPDLSASPVFFGPKEDMPVLAPDGSVFTYHYRTTDRQFHAKPRGTIYPSSENSSASLSLKFLKDSERGAG